MECSIIDSSFDNICYDSFSWLEVDDRYIYIGFSQGNIRIHNRWTRECIKKIDRPDVLPRRTELNCLQLSDRHLVTKFNNGTIVIYYLATFE